MLTVNEAISVFNQSYKDLTVTKAADFDNRHFLFCAVEDPNKTYYNDPFYLVNKKNGAINRFLPSENMNGFMNAITKKEIDLNGA